MHDIVNFGKISQIIHFSEDIMKQMPVEGRKFNKVSNFFIIIIFFAPEAYTLYSIEGPVTPLLGF